MTIFLFAVEMWGEFRTGREVLEPRCPSKSLAVRTLEPACVFLINTLHSSAEHSTFLHLSDDPGPEASVACYFSHDNRHLRFL